MSQSTQTTLSPFDQAIEAIISGDTIKLSQLLNEHPNLPKKQSSAEHQATLLHYVSANGVEDDKQITPNNVLEIAEILLKAGANPNQMSNIYDGGQASTALVALVSSTHPAQAGKMDDLVRLFCKYADPNGIDNDQLPIATAISFRYQDALNALVESGAIVDNIVHAAAIGDLELVKKLFIADLAPYTNSFGMTTDSQQKLRELALSAACMSGELEIVQYLVEQGVDIEAKASIEDGSALNEAAINNQIEVVRYLLEQGADVASEDHQGFTALHWAAWHGHLDLVALFLDNNSPLEHVNAYGGTVIDTAVYGYVNTNYPVVNQIETLQLLIDAGADVTRISPYPTGNEAIDAFLKPHKS